MRIICLLSIILFLLGPVMAGKENVFAKPVYATYKGNDIALQLYGTVTYQDKPLEGVIFELKKNDVVVSSQTTNKKGKYKFALELSSSDEQNEYIVLISKPGMVTKKLSINTFIPKNALAEVGDDFEYELDVTMVVQREKDIVLRNPSAKIKWDKPKRNFGFDQRYARIVQKEERIFEQDPKKYKEYMDKQVKDKEDAEKAKLLAQQKAKEEAERKQKEEEEKKKKKEEAEKRLAEFKLKKSLGQLKQQQSQIVKEQELTPKKEEETYFYVVQLASVKKDSGKKKKFPALGTMRIDERPKGDNIKYTVGLFTKRDEAYKLKEEVVKKGIEGAFVIKLTASEIGKELKEEPLMPKGQAVKKDTDTLLVDTAKAKEEPLVQSPLAPEKMDDKSEYMDSRTSADILNIRKLEEERARNLVRKKRQELRKGKNLSIKNDSDNPLKSLYDEIEVYHATIKGKSYTK